MFSRCTSLINAPELPAQRLKQFCYREMFNGCTNLSYIKAVFNSCWSEKPEDSSIPDYVLKDVKSCLYNWVKNVSTGGYIEITFRGLHLV